MINQQDLLPYMPAWAPLLGHPTLQRYASHKRQLAITLTLPMDQQAMLLRTLSPINPGSGVIQWNQQWDVPPPWVRGNDSVSTGTSFSCCNPHLLNCTHYQNGICAIEKGERGGFCPGVSAPVHLFLPSLPPLPSKYSMHSQVKLLKLPTSFYSRPDRHILFFSGTIIWPLSLFSPLAWRTFQYTQKALPKFTQ